MDSALRENLSAALSDKLDQQVINGPNGFLGTSSVLAAVNNPNTEAAFADYRNLVYNTTPFLTGCTHIRRVT